jgi:apolipoprotein N-acyltransferase
MPECVKHHPVPGEPILVGHDPQTAIDTAFGRLSGALCYDYDYPAIAAEHGRLGADIVALPSSDWRGIDPIHTEMATMRAIEQGLSIVRSTRFGLSAGIDPHGVMRARRSSFETQGRILWIDSPATRDSDRLSKDRRRVRCRLHDARRGLSALHRESKPGLFERPSHR